MNSFHDKVAAITGAASGIGRALAVALAERGCHLALSDVDEPGLAATAEQARAHGVRVTTARVDVASRDEVHAWADAVVGDHGRCNLIFNNAGVTYGATVEGGEYAELERVMGINFWGVVHGTKAFLPALRASGEGHVINVSSVFGMIAFPGQSIYNASKFAVRGYTESLQVELTLMGAPVRATCVHPGGIKTNIARTARMHGSVADLGMTKEQDGHSFEKFFRTTPAAAAEVILRGVRRGDRRVLIGGDATLIDVMQRALPTAYQRLVGFAVVRGRSLL